MSSTRVSVDGYRLLARIGEGGMGVVHVAEAPDGRRVAIKVLRPHVIGDDEGRQRLAREVASLQHVRSARVAEVLDADPWGETPYIVTRYVPGHSLHETVRRDGPLALADLEHAARGLLEAVRDVHAVDVLHRDIKPTNVVMEGRSPVLIDFGLARLAEDPRLTAAGFLLGTPGYLAPEVLLGDSATTATDVHGWAATIAYAATGEPPYGRGHTMAILERTRRGEADLRAVPDRLRPLLTACLSPEPLDRPTPREVLDQLDGSAAPTMPWQLVPPEEPSTEVLPKTPPQPPAPPPATPVTPTTPVTSVTTPATTAYPTRVAPPVPTSIAPTPVQHANPRPAPQAQPQPQLPPAPLPADRFRPLSGWARFRRTLVLLGLLTVVASAFRLAPYLTFAGLAVAVPLLRGVSHSQETSWRRRMTRGARWFDAPLAVGGYPWHVLRGSVAAALLLVVAGAGTAWGVGALVLLDVPPRDALLVGGVLAALLTWRGPGSRRVRHPVGRGVTAAVRHPVPGWLLVLGTAVVAVGLWAMVQGSEVTWAPASAPPWEQVRGLVSDELERWTGGL